MIHHIVYKTLTLFTETKQALYEHFEEKYRRARQIEDLSGFSQQYVQRCTTNCNVLVEYSLNDPLNCY